jgi:prophage antirepressor-like protein
MPPRAALTHPPQGGISASISYQTGARQFAPNISAPSALTTFDFNSNAIRVVTLDGAPGFVAADVCDVLGINRSAGRWQGLRALAADERVVVNRSTPHLAGGSAEGLFGYRQPSASLISESGLYKLVLRSDKPQAKPFQDWVTRVVLPAIRKDGGYMLGCFRTCSIVDIPGTRFPLCFVAQ